MTRLFGAGALSAIAASCALAFGGSSAASAQVATIAATPLAQSVLKPLAATASAAQATVSAALPQSGSAGTSAAASASASASFGLWGLIWANMAGTPLDEELNCIATAVYFESRGEPFEGQLAVAEVVINRARSGRYPSSYCAVVKQPAQFSFVRRGQFPAIDTGSASWSYAQSIARIASKQLASQLPGDVLWYHADYVAPSWGRRLSRVDKIGAHIFYRA